METLLEAELVEELEALLSEAQRRLMVRQARRLKRQRGLKSARTKTVQKTHKVTSAARTKAARNRFRY